MTCMRALETCLDVGVLTPPSPTQELSEAGPMAERLLRVACPHPTPPCLTRQQLVVGKAWVSVPDGESLRARTESGPSSVLELCGWKAQPCIWSLVSSQCPMKEAGETFPPCVTEMETEAQSKERIIVFGTPGPTPTQFPTLGLNTGIKMAELK